MQAWYSGHIVNLRYTAFLFTGSGGARQSALNETDLTARLRTIAAHRMETRTEHIVPLSKAALAPLTQVLDGVAEKMLRGLMNAWSAFIDAPPSYHSLKWASIFE